MLRAPRFAHDETALLERASNCLLFGRLPLLVFLRNQKGHHHVGGVPSLNARVALNTQWILAPVQKPREALALCVSWFTSPRGRGGSLAQQEGNRA